jgi:oligopeptide/dipeptide ABC transporter ATP-binding protein
MSSSPPPPEERPGGSPAPGHEPAPGPEGGAVLEADHGSAPLLQVQNLRVELAGENGPIRVVDGVGFEVEKGERLGIVGESGCGKTMTALAVVGLLPQPGGRIVEGSSVRFRGGELAGLRPSRLRRFRGSSIAMVFQEPDTSLNPVQRIGNQVAEVIRLHGRVGRREAREVAVGLLHEVGLPDAESRFQMYPHQLSGGMRQRVLIAMALAGEPELLIADEPTTALDVTIQAQILDLLARLGKERGMALLLITHDLGVVAEVCDRVLVMYAGQLVEAGTVGEVFLDPRHPYTRGLLSSVPGYGAEGAPPEPIPGTVPRPANWPAGCRFHPRCPRAWDRCRETPPPLFRLAEPGSSGRESRCWLEASADEEEEAGGTGVEP